MVEKNPAEQQGKGELQASLAVDVGVLDRQRERER